MMMNKKMIQNTNACGYHITVVGTIFSATEQKGLEKRFTQR